MRARHWPMATALALLCLAAVPGASAPPAAGPDPGAAAGAAAPAAESGLGELKITTQSGKTLAPALEEEPDDATEPLPETAPTPVAPLPRPEPAAQTGLVPEAEWSEALHRASEAYAAGRYAAAVKLYQRLLDSGLDNGHVHYNLGNSLVRSGRLGQGIAAYLRAERLLPRDGDVRANLGYARQSTKDAIEPVAPSALVQTLFFWHYGLSAREVLLLTGLLNLLFWAGLIVRLFRRESEALRWAVVGLLLVLLACGGSLLARTAWPTDLAVAVAPEVKVRSGTVRDATVLFELHEGAEVELLGEDAGWLKIRLADGKRGWLIADGVERVD